MEEDTPPEPNRASPAAPPNQTLIMGLLLGAMVLLVVLVVISRGSGTSSSTAKELSELRALVASKQAEINAESERLGLAPLGNGTTAANVQALANKVSSDANYLGTLVADLEKSMGSQATRLANAEATRDSLADRLRDLNEQLASARAQAGDSQRLATQITDLEARLASSRTQVAELQNQLAKSPSSGEVASLQQQLADTMAARDLLSKEITAMQTDTTTSEELASLRAEVAKLGPENNKLRYEVQRLQALLDRAKLFVESADDLAPAAMRLITELRGLDSADGPVNIRDEYIRINAELKASVIDTINFATDSSRIDFDKAESLRRLLAETAPDSFLLVVGYASTTGDAAHNQTLSSERATRVVSVVNSHRREDQRLQALFFGQTDRFSESDPARNQVCEVWEIRK